MINIMNVQKFHVFKILKEEVLDKHSSLPPPPLPVFLRLITPSLPSGHTVRTSPRDCLVSSWPCRADCQLDVSAESLTMGPLSAVGQWHPSSFPSVWMSSRGKPWSWWLWCGQYKRACCAMTVVITRVLTNLEWTKLSMVEAVFFFY